MTIVSPWLFETATLTAMGLAGITILALVGLRNPLIIAGSALGVSALLRVVVTLAEWSVGPFQLATELWWVAIGALSAVFLGLVAVGRFPVVWPSLAVYSVLVLLALGSKYVLGIGERHHSDSANTVALSLLIIQADAPEEGLGESVKRGLSYPLLLALGPEGRILGGVTPLIFLSTLTLALGLARHILGIRFLRILLVTSVAVVAIVATSVPIIRVAPFYLNAHTLAGYGTLLIVTAGFLAATEKKIGSGPIALAVAGGVTVATARGEGIVFAALALALLASAQHTWSRSDRFTFVAATLAPLVASLWWFDQVNASVTEAFGLSPVIILLAGLAAAIMVASPLADRMRMWILPVLTIALCVYVFGRPLLTGDPLLPVRAMWNNVVLGYGGWGVWFSALIATLILIGWSRRTSGYRQLALITVILILGAIVAHMLFSGGGYGREGFYGSLNRMWLQALPVSIVTLLVGIAEVIWSAFSPANGRHRDSVGEAGYTSTGGTEPKGVLQ